MNKNPTVSRNYPVSWSNTVTNKLVLSKDFHKPCILKGLRQREYVTRDRRRGGNKSREESRGAKKI